MAIIHLNREDWLLAAIEEVRPAFAAEGLSVSERIRVACGFPAHAARSGRVGECHASAASADQHYELLISPVLADPTKVLATLLHELCHTLPGCMNHGATFARAAARVGLSTLAGNWKATGPGVDFDSRYGQIIAGLGDYPHAVLSLGDGKKQSTRMLKAVCPDCGYTIRLTKKWADMGLPICGLDGATFNLA